jgi:small conductance mechanosensitive channel
VLTLAAGFIGAAVVLDTLGLNVAPIVAGVGVVGIAIGLGAQTLIKDVINGIFILVEDQYAVGDLVTIAGVTGEVLEVNPRRTLLRDEDGNMHSIPNSTITTATNRTASLQRMHVVIEVAYRDAQLAARLAHDVAGGLAAERPGDVLVPPAVRSYSVTADGDVRLDILGDARPGVRWEVEGELRRRLRRKFEEAKLEVRYPAPAA